MLKLKSSLKTILGNGKTGKKNNSGNSKNSELCKEIKISKRKNLKFNFKFLKIEPKITNNSLMMNGKIK